MQLTHEINRLTIGLLITFALIALGAAYWAISGPDTILARTDNPRLVIARANIIRGSIYDRRGKLLAESILDENATVRRNYLYPETSSAIGYYSFRYGAGGGEAAYDSILTGEDPSYTTASYFETSILHRAREGSDIQLTFDLETQQSIFAAMQNYTGAAIAMTVPEGQILAMVSLPSFDPNKLDTEWEQLVNLPGDPFFNRALQGNYQPGGMMQTVLMALAAVTRAPFDTAMDNATEPVKIDDITIPCAYPPPSNQLTLAQAYQYGCPRPFIHLVENLEASQLQETITTFRLNQPVTLPGFVAEPENTADTSPEAFILSPDETIVELALGQGKLTVTPLRMAGITAAIVNRGNAPFPRAFLARRLPSETAWIVDATIYGSEPMMTAETAQRLQELMIRNVEQGTIHIRSIPSARVGARAALSYSGETMQTWFTGFAASDQTSGVVVTIVLENMDDPAAAAIIGEIALRAAYNALRDE